MLHWVGLLFAPTTIIAFIVLFVGLQQYALAKEKLRLDSYDKRFKIFELIRAFIDLVQYMDPKPGDKYLDTCFEAYNKLIGRSGDALFLFKNSEIYTELVKIRIHGIIFLNKHRALQELYNNTPLGVSLNIPINLKNMRSAAKFKFEIVVMGQHAIAMLSSYLTIVDSPPLIIFPEGLLEKYNNKKHNIYLYLNRSSHKHLHFSIFPLSLISLVIIAGIEVTILICIWIIAD